MSPYRFHPTVFCVKDSYQIVFLTEKPGMGWVEIAGEKYFDAQNGLMRWNDEMHRVSVPCEALDRAVAMCAEADAKMKSSPLGYIPLERLICSVRLR